MPSQHWGVKAAPVQDQPVTHIKFKAHLGFIPKLKTVSKQMNKKLSNHASLNPR
jgi:hypothetical protein